MSQTAPTLETLDKNFTLDATPSRSADGLAWVDAFSPRLSLRGHGWPGEAMAARSFRRIPERSVERFSPAIGLLSRCPASVFLSFASDTTQLHVRQCNTDADGMNHMPMAGSNGLELYVYDQGAWVPWNVAIPTPEDRTFQRVLFKDLPRRQRSFRLYLPPYKGLESLTLGFDPGAGVEPLPRDPACKPILFYGTSVTQGGCANTAGSDYISLLGRMLDRDTVNLGFSGNGKGEPEMAELIREVDAALFTIQYASNCTPEWVDATLPVFLRLLRETRPLAPVALIGTIGFSRGRWCPILHREMEARRDIQMRHYLAAKAAGDRHLHFIDGEGLLPPGLSGTSVDGLHPTSAGFALMAERLAQHLAMILNWEENG